MGAGARCPGGRFIADGERRLRYPVHDFVLEKFADAGGNLTVLLVRTIGRYVLAVGLRAVAYLSTDDDDLVVAVEIGDVLGC
mgnify:CR=1 FL=1